jgi:hypothetical protein
MGSAGLGRRENDYDEENDQTARASGRVNFFS